jgi:hypothetical protein
LAVCLPMLTGPSHVKNLACEDWGAYLSLLSFCRDFPACIPTSLVFSSSPLLLTTYHFQAVPPEFNGSSAWHVPRMEAHASIDDSIPLHVCIHVHHDLVTFSTPPRLIVAVNLCQPACMHVGESRNAFDSHCLCTVVVPMYPLYVHQYLCVVTMRDWADR